MLLLLNCVDPRGFRVVLYENRYSSHIARRRDYISAESIGWALEEPELITAGEHYEMRENYYAKDVMEDYPELFLKVVVEFGGAGGKVITAFDVDRPKPTERIVWPPQD